ncbi:hypothetical protein K2Z84_19320 [Candidatus Binatia bacterium]|nr:hypothetical protein [Candidatus Binatia bacterium]
MPRRSMGQVDPKDAVGRITATTLATCAVAALAGACVAAFLLTPHNPFWQAPFHHDDFELLATSLAAPPWPLVRPASDLAYAALSGIHAQALYLTLFALVVLYQALATLFAARLLELRRSTRALAAASAVVAFCFFLVEDSPEAYRYTGTLTNAMSTTFGTATALLVLRAGELARAPRIGTVALFAFAALAKEDCVPFVLLVAGLTLLREIVAQRHERVRRACALLAALLPVGAGALLYGRLVVDSPFTGGAGVYETRFAPHDLAQVAWQYLTIAPGACLILGALIVVTIVAFVLRRDVAWRIACVWLLVAAWILPYAPLLRHVFGLYTYDWLPLMLAAIVLGSTELARGLERGARRASAAGALAALAVFAVVTTPGRAGRAAEFTVKQDTNARILGELARHRDALAREREVVVTGLDQVQTPWWFTRAEYVDRTIGGDVRWIFAAAPDSLLAIEHRNFDRSLDNGAIAIVPPTCVEQLDGVARLAFAPDLTATLEPGRPAGRSEPIRGRVALTDEAGARLLCRGWSAPERRDGTIVRWAEGPLAMLAVALPRDRDFRLRARVRAAPGLRVEQQWVAISVDGRRVRVARVSESGNEIEALVPAGTTRGAASVVTLEFADWLRPDGEAADARSHAAAGVEWVEVE